MRHRNQQTRHLLMGRGPAPVTGRFSAQTQIHPVVGSPDSGNGPGGPIITPPCSRHFLSVVGGVTQTNGSGASSGLPDRPPTPFIDYRTAGPYAPAGGGCGGASRFDTRTRNPVPAPKFAHSLTRCTELSEESVRDVAHGEIVEVELTPAGAKRTTWRGASTTTNRPNATGPSRGTRIGATTSPSYDEEVD